MELADSKVYPYRWVVLGTFMFVAGMTQLLWITFAPITGKAAEFYRVPDLMIGLLSMTFMAVYLAVAMPSAWVIDTYGFRVAVGIGAMLTGIFALTRGIFASSYVVVLVSQIGIAIGQPFVLGSMTKVAARWFPTKQRVTATGLGSLSLYIGILVGMILTPYLTLEYGIKGMLIVYGAVSAISAIMFVVLARETPPSTSPCPDNEGRALVFDGLRRLFRKSDFILLMIIFFVGLGTFNAVSTWIENIVSPRGFSISQAGTLGGLMLAGGIIGALVLPILSDKFHKRKPFILVALIGLIPGLMGITFAESYWLLLVSGTIFGFFLLSAGPVVLQYGAEVALPAPEGTASNLLWFMGQISGIIFIFSMDLLKTSRGSMTPSLLVLTGFLIVSFVLALRLRESPQLRSV
jgi:sugar phosphate permease